MGENNVYRKFRTPVPLMLLFLQGKSLVLLITDRKYEMNGQS